MRDGLGSTPLHLIVRYSNPSESHNMSLRVRFRVQFRVTVRFLGVGLPFGPDLAESCRSLAPPRSRV